MAGSVNKVILVGNLGKDPEMANFANGGSVVKFSLATSESWTDKSTNERREKTEWHNIVIYNENIAKTAKQYLRKGSKVYIEGQIQSRKYQDNTGNERYITEIVLQRFRGEMLMLEGRGGDSAGGDQGERGYDEAPRSSAQAYGGGGAKKPAVGGFSDDLDDDVPF